jgi:hypothetical protein
MEVVLAVVVGVRRRLWPRRSTAVARHDIHGVFQGDIRTFT